MYTNLALLNVMGYCSVSSSVQLSTSKSNIDTVDLRFVINGFPVKSKKQLEDSKD